MPVSLHVVIALMVAMTTKHLVADFFLQSTSIALGKAADRGWAEPLALHAGAHAVLTLAVVLVFAPRLWWLAPAEFLLHAAIDRAKVVVGRDAHLCSADPAYWWLFGIDQYLHQITNIALVGALAALAA